MGAREGERREGCRKGVGRGGWGGGGGAFTQRHHTAKGACPNDFWKK